MHSLVGKRKLGSSLEFQEIFQDWSTDFGKWELKFEEKKKPSGRENGQRSNSKEKPVKQFMLSS
jgi:hypothetical protein